MPSPSPSHSSYPTPSNHPYIYTLYTFSHSSCSARVRIAAHLKRIPLEYKYIRLHKGEQHLPDFIRNVNPSASLPVLVVWRKISVEASSTHDAEQSTNPNGSKSGVNEIGTQLESEGQEGREETPVAIITQSIAILEYLEESFPSPVQLLPPGSDPLLRAKVRELTNIVVCDIQPVTNMRVFKKVGELLNDASRRSNPDSKSSLITEDHAETEKASWSEDEWQRHFMMLGLHAYERLLSKPSNPPASYLPQFSLTDYPTIADVALIAATDRAVRYGIDMGQFPRISTVDRAMRNLEAYKRGGWRAQEDTFKSLREKL